MPRILNLLICLPLCMCLAPERPTANGRPVAAEEELTFDSSRPVPTPEAFDRLARTDPVAMLEAALKRYRLEVRGYRCTLVKQERIGGKLRDEEVIDCAFREQPFSVLMRWRAGAGQADGSLFVDGEHRDQMLVRPSNPLLRLAVGGYAKVSTGDPRARESSRYAIHEFGVAKGMERTYKAWKAARDAGTMRAEYLGLKRVPEAGGRLCHVWRRDCDPPEEDGQTSITVAIDAENWLQVSSELRAGDELIARYHFRDLELNPAFAPDAFDPEQLKKD